MQQLITQLSLDPHLIPFFRGGILGLGSSQSARTAMAAITLSRKALSGVFSRSHAAVPAAATLALHTSSLVADASILRNDTSPPFPSTSPSSPPPCPAQTSPHVSHQTYPRTSFQAAATGSSSPSPSSLLHHHQQPLLHFITRGAATAFHSATAFNSSTAGAFGSNGARGYSSVDIHGTTVLCVRKGNSVVIAADGQVTMGAQILKPNVRKVRRLGEKKSVIAGFAGTTADAFTLFDRFESRIDEYPGQLTRAAVELAKAWRTDKYLRKLDAMLVVADAKVSLTITGNGDVLEPHDGIIGIGSGGPYALAAARALADIPDLTAEAIVKKAMRIAADCCIYTNENVTMEQITMEQITMEQITTEDEPASSS
ncbi:unnamed protein product [Closterium sp. Naga37s-1]|nr:unnamed protein product [Closterium sp. Naga37s-1]